MDAVQVMPQDRQRACVQFLLLFSLSGGSSEPPHFQIGTHKVMIMNLIKVFSETCPNHLMLKWNKKKTNQSLLKNRSMLLSCLIVHSVFLHSTNREAHPLHISQTSTASDKTPVLDVTDWEQVGHAGWLHLTQLSSYIHWLMNMILSSSVWNFLNFSIRVITFLISHPDFLWCILFLTWEFMWTGSLLESASSGH